MILSGPEIRKQRTEGRILIDPFDDAQINPASYDLRLGSEFLYYPDLTVLDSRNWSRYGVCPNVRKADVACAWACLECGARGMPPTVGSVSTGDYGKSRVFGPGVPGGVRCALSG